LLTNVWVFFFGFISFAIIISLPGEPIYLHLRALGLGWWWCDWRLLKCPKPFSLSSIFPRRLSSLPQNVKQSSINKFGKCLLSSRIFRISSKTMTFYNSETIRSEPKIESHFSPNPHSLRHVFGSWDRALKSTHIISLSMRDCMRFYPFQFLHFPPMNLHDRSAPVSWSRPTADPPKSTRSSLNQDLLRGRVRNLQVCQRLDSVTGGAGGGDFKKTKIPKRPHPN